MKHIIIVETYHFCRSRCELFISRRQLICSTCHVYHLECLSRGDIDNDIVASDIYFILQVVYSGKAHDDPLEFFKKFGHVCEPNFNPADFYSRSNCVSCSSAKFIVFDLPIMVGIKIVQVGKYSCLSIVVVGLSIKSVIEHRLRK